MKSPRRLATHKAVRILDDDGNEASVGEIGAIAILGGMVIAGYWNRPKATADIFTVGGWLKTRDSGCPDADRYVFVHDRVTDMIVPGGGISIPPRWRTRYRAAQASRTPPSSVCRTPPGEKR